MQNKDHWTISSGSSRLVRGGGLRNMKSIRLPSAAIFFMTNFYRAGGSWPLGPPGSAIDNRFEIMPACNIRSCQT